MPTPAQHNELHTAVAAARSLDPETDPTCCIGWGPTAGMCDQPAVECGLCDDCDELRWIELGIEAVRGDGSERRRRNVDHEPDRYEIEYGDDE